MLVRYLFKPIFDNILGRKFEDLIAQLYYGTNTLQLHNKRGVVQSIHWLASHTVPLKRPFVVKMLAVLALF